MSINEGDPARGLERKHASLLFNNKRINQEKDDVINMKNV